MPPFCPYGMIVKRIHKAIIGIASVVLAVLLADGIAFFRDEQWQTQLREDLPVGTPLEDVRIYLKDQGRQHGINGLWEDDRPNYPGFVFRNHNHSIITRSIIEGDLDYVLLMGNMRINLDEDGHLKEIYVFK